MYVSVQTDSPAFLLEPPNFYTFSCWLKGICFFFLHFKHYSVFPVHLLRVLILLLLTVHQFCSILSVMSKPCLWPTHFALPHLKEPPHCLCLSSLLCTVYSALWHQNTTHGQNEFQGQENTRLSDLAAFAARRAFTAVAKTRPDKSIALLFFLSSGWGPNWGIKMERVLPQESMNMLRNF